MDDNSKQARETFNIASGGSTPRGQLGEPAASHPATQGLTVGQGGGVLPNLQIQQAERELLLSAGQGASTLMDRIPAGAFQPAAAESFV